VLVAAKEKKGSIKIKMNFFTGEPLVDKSLFIKDSGKSK
jgi:sulfatase maturation enzyme AslB (radical SAM superfamily)